ncbi:MAG TPA: hypothetical protein VGF86_15955 [Candidatus Tumulicola sp.]
MPEDDAFFGPALKYHRGCEHIRDTTFTVNSYLARKPYSVTAERKTKSGKQLVWVTRVKEAIPKFLPGIIGDAIHNLWDSLELVTTAAARKTVRNDRDVHFPTRGSKQRFECAVDEGFKKWPSPGIVGVFKTMIQAYPRGNGYLLRALHDLAIQDKHRLITPILSTVEIQAIVGYNKGGNQVILGMPVQRGPVKDGAELTRTPTIDGLEIGDNAYAALTISFDQSVPALKEGKIVATLIQIAYDVQAALDLLRPYV